MSYVVPARRVEEGVSIVCFDCAYPLGSSFGMESVKVVVVVFEELNHFQRMKKLT